MKSEFKGEFIMECNKRDKIKKIILDDCGGKFSPQEILEKVVDNIYEKLKEIPNDYNELLSAYIRL